jgi:hypothetical protein
MMRLNQAYRPERRSKESRRNTKKDSEIGTVERTCRGEKRIVVKKGSRFFSTRKIFKVRPPSKLPVQILQVI